jgi:hypothetical protein
MTKRPLFIATALIEVGVGLALIVSPAWTVAILIGGRFDTAADTVVGRVAGAALLALALVSWLARNEDYSGAATGIVWGLLLYNAGAGAVLVYAGIGLRLSGIGLWPAVALHVAMAFWCVAVVARRMD